MAEEKSSPVMETHSVFNSSGLSASQTFELLVGNSDLIVSDYDTARRPNNVTASIRKFSEE